MSVRIWCAINTQKCGNICIGIGDWKLFQLIISPIFIWLADFITWEWGSFLGHPCIPKSFITKKWWYRMPWYNIKSEIWFFSETVACKNCQKLFDHILLLLCCRGINKLYILTWNKRQQEVKLWTRTSAEDVRKCVAYPESIIRGFLVTSTRCLE